MKKNDNYDTSTLTDEQLAKKAQEELNMEGEMEEVGESSFCGVVDGEWRRVEKFYCDRHFWSLFCFFRLFQRTDDSANFAISLLPKRSVFRSFHNNHYYVHMNF